MKHTSKLLRLFLATCLLSSCQLVSEKSNLPVIPLNENQEVTQVYASSLISDIEYIPLQTDSVFIRFIRSLEITENNIFLNGGHDGILRFDSKGKFLNRIGSVGKGPGEYFKSASFSVSSEKQEVYVCNRKSMEVYNFDGEHINTVALFNWLHNAISYTGGFVCTSLNPNGQAEYIYTCIDSKGTKCGSRKNQYKFTPKIKNLSIFQDIYFFNSGEELTFKEQHSDTVFTFGFPPKARFIYDQGNHKFLSKYRETFGPDPKNPHPDVNLVHKIIETPKKILTRYNLFTNDPMKKKYLCSIFDKETEESVLYDEKTGIINDIDGGMNCSPRISFGSDVYGWSDALKFKEYLGSSKFKKAEPNFKEGKEEFKAFVDNLSVDDNPVIIRMKLK